MKTLKPIQQVADETRDALIRHIEANTEEADARREEEREARIQALLAEFAREDELPPK